jgi:hypothetical protein
MHPIEVFVRNLFLATVGRRAADRWMNDALAEARSRPRPSDAAREAIVRAHALAASERAPELCVSHLVRVLEDRAGDPPELRAGSIQYSPALRSAFVAAATAARARGGSEITVDDLLLALRSTRA